MKLSCPSCSARYSISDDRIAGRRAKIRCKRCAADIVVAGPGARAGDPALEMHVLCGAEQRGPLSLREVEALAASGEIDGATLGWHAALEDWAPLASIPELQGVRFGSIFDAAPEESPFAAESDLVTSVAPIRTPGSHATGARNESSVLFSFQTLGALAAPQPRAMASGEGSGLIDIRALAAAVSPGAPVSRPIDLVLGVGAPALASPLSAPVIVPEPRRAHRSLTALAALAAVTALALGGAALVTTLRRPVVAVEPAPLEIAPPVAPVVPPPLAPAIDEPVIATVVGEAEPESAPVLVAERPAVRRPRPEVVAREEAPARHEEIVPARGERTLEEMMSDTLPRGDERETARAERVELPETPARDSVRAAMTALEPEIRACADGAHGRALLSVVVGGETGHARSATVGGDFAGTEAGGCMARVARGVELAPFERATFTIAYPFAL